MLCAPTITLIVETDPKGFRDIDRWLNRHHGVVENRWRILAIYWFLSITDFESQRMVRLIFQVQTKEIADALAAFSRPLSAEGMFA